MNTISWTKKYRPNNLNSYIGDKFVKQKIMSMFKTKKFFQTILLEGERGCGKTTLSHIIVKILACKFPLESGLACEKCVNCKKFITGEQFDDVQLYEIDMTKLNSKEDMVNLIEQMKTKPVGNQKKIYIIDEIQFASSEAQKYFLNIVEEFESYLYIILCTTNSEEIIDSLKSEFNSIKLRRPSEDDILEYLKFICREENINYDEAALRLIVNHANRLPRESINKLQMISSDRKITYGNVVEEFKNGGIL